MRVFRSRRWHVCWALNVIKPRGTQRTNRVHLYQALGGSFDAAPKTVTSARK